MLDENKLGRLVERFDALAAEMASGPDADTYVKLAREYSELEPLASSVRQYRAALEEQAELQALAGDRSDEPELAEIARTELDQLNAKLPDYEAEIKFLLLPRDAADDKSAILEVRAGTGGDEAALFAGDLVRMYLRYAENRKWKVEVLSASVGEVGGFKEFVALIKGKGVFQRMKFESGVHRVQRVPETESGGRIHTSAATVAVLPEAQEVDVHIEDKDLRIDVYRASGPGGQSVNTTDSAVRITHLPTGLVVTQQDEKSQHKNRAKAMTVLRSRLYDLERSRQDEERAADRRGQVGSGDRSQRVRTYNFPQGRITDHRINLTLYKLEQILAGTELDEVIDALTAEDRAQRLAALEDDL
ncbi:MAG: peptide chain release factor 1 [Alphaproteobacteria bacterium]